MFLWGIRGAHVEGRKIWLPNSASPCSRRPGPIVSMPSGAEGATCGVFFFLGGGAWSLLAGGVIFDNPKVGENRPCSRVWPQSQEVNEDSHNL